MNLSHRLIKIAARAMLMLGLAASSATWAVCDVSLVSVFANGQAVLKADCGSTPISQITWFQNSTNVATNAIAVATQNVVTTTQDIYYTTAITTGTSTFTAIGNGNTVPVPAGKAATIISGQTALTVAVGLVTSATGTPAGTVSSTPPGFTCSGGYCATNYPVGASVTLTANPGNGTSFFGGWGGDCSGTGACVIAMTGPRTVTATFNSAPPPPAPTCSSLIANPSSVTVGMPTTVNFSASCSNSPTSYVWTATNSGPTITGTGSTATAFFPAVTATTYTYQVVAANGGGSGSASTSVTVSATPPPPPPPVTPSACGTNSGAVSTALSSASPNICALGNAVSSFGGSGTSAAPWTWLCTGLNNTSSASCSATMIVPTTNPGLPAGCTLKERALEWPNWGPGNASNAPGVPFITQSAGTTLAIKFSLDDLISPARQATTPYATLHFYQGPDVSIELSNQPCQTSTTATPDTCRMHFIGYGDKYFVGPVIPPSFAGTATQFTGSTYSGCPLPPPAAGGFYFVNVKVNSAAPGYYLMYENGL